MHPVVAALSKNTAVISLQWKLFEECCLYTHCFPDLHPLSSNAVSTEFYVFGA